MRHHTRQRRLSVALLAIATPFVASADGFALFSKHEELKAHVVVDAGNVEKIEPPFGTLSINEVLKLGGKCFQPLGFVGLSGLEKKAGLLLVDRFRSLKLALLESSIGSVKVGEVVSVTQITCPSPTSDGLPSDPQQALQELKRRQELLQRELERLKRQRQ